MTSEDADRISRLEQQQELLRSALLQDEAAAKRVEVVEGELWGAVDRIGALEKAAEADGRDWRLLTAAVGRAKTLEETERIALDEIGILKKRLTAAEARISRLTATNWLTWIVGVTVLMAMYADLSS